MRINDDQVAWAISYDSVDNIQDSDAIPLLAKDLQEARTALKKIAALPPGHFTMTAQKIAEEALR
jgi:hypothetical protein